MSNVGQIYKIRVLIDFVTDLYDLQRVPAHVMSGDSFECYECRERLSSASQQSLHNIHYFYNPSTTTFHFEGLLLVP